MHEFSSVKPLVLKILQQIEKNPSQKIQVIRLRVDGSFTVEAVQQAFAALVKGTPLEGAHLVIERVIRHLQCACGRTQDLMADEATGYLFICPACGDMLEFEKGPEMELLEIISDSPALSAWCGNGPTLKLTKAS